MATIIIEQAYALIQEKAQETTDKVVKQKEYVEKLINELISEGSKQLQLRGAVEQLLKVKEQEIKAQTMIQIENGLLKEIYSYIETQQVSKVKTILDVL